MSARRDVTVIGAGPAGCAAAIALRRAGVERVLLVEAGTGQRPPFVESLPPDTRLLLAQLGLLEAFEALQFDPCYGSASSWGAGPLGGNDFLFNPHGTGWHVDRRRLDAFLRGQAEGRGVELRLGTRLEGAAAGTGGARLRLRLRGPGGQEDTVETAFAIDASGRAARLARMMGSERLAGDRFVCLAALLPLGGDSTLGQRCLLEAVEYGWWYAARLGPAQALVLAAADARAVRERGLQGAARWHGALAQTRHVGAELGRGIPAPGELVVRQARSARMSRCSGPGWLAVGDAACIYDPISSQGVHKALLEGQAGARRAMRVLGGAAGNDVLHEHEHAMQERFAGYLRLRQHLYDSEMRWPGAPFWRARRRAHAAQAEDPPIPPRRSADELQHALADR
jgi:flavin-dependent dehydrogenase